MKSSQGILREYQLETELAEARLVAAERARQLVEEALIALSGADVRNHKVRNALLAAQSEIAIYKRSTKFAIRKRQERMKKCRQSTN